MAKKTKKKICSALSFGEDFFSLLGADHSALPIFFCIWLLSLDNGAFHLLFHTSSEVVARISGIGFPPPGSPSACPWHALGRV